MSRSRQRWLLWSGAALYAILFWLLSNGQVYNHFAVTPDQALVYDVEAPGILAISLAFGYQVIGIRLVITSRNPVARPFVWPLVLLPIVIALSAVRGLQSLPGTRWICCSCLWLPRAPSSVNR